MKKYICTLLLAASFPVFSQVPVSPAPDQLALLKSKDAKLAANKKLVFDFWRIVLDAHHTDQVVKFVDSGYIQHNPMVPTGRDALVKFIGTMPRREIQPAIADPIVSITAEEDLVTIAFMLSEPDPRNSGKMYTTTRFDMFRVKDGRIVEHWDDARLGVPPPGGGGPPPAAGAP